MRVRHATKMHPEFERRLFPWIESEQGRIGIGSGWRSSQPTDSDGGRFAPPGMSFHESQQFASGFVGYAAVDLVHINPGRVHRAPTWAEVESAKAYGLHAFIRRPKEEPWHVQCVEMRGFGTWVNAGRPDPRPIPLPSDPPIIVDPTPDLPPTPDPNPLEIPAMLFIAKPTFQGAKASDPWIVYYENPGNAPRAERATNAHVKAAALLGVPVVDQDSQEQYQQARTKYGI